MPPTSPDTDLLDRYFANECTPAERALVDAWAASPEHALRLAVLRRAVAEPFGPVAFSSPAELRERLWNAADAAEQGAPSVASPSVVAPTVSTVRGGPGVRALAGRAGTVGGGAPRPFARWWPALVGGALVVAAAVVGWRSGLFRAGAPLPVTMSTYATTNGERANITLPDGSTVMLNVASRLEVPADYATGHRTVRLTGEALFTVYHREKAPFTVVAGGTAARVLGTSFVVRHYATDTTTAVAVRDGKVAVQGGAIQSVVLTASRYIEIGSRGAARLGEGDRSLFDFAAGVLTIHSTPLMQAIPELNRWYAADVQLGDPSFARVPIEGKFTAGSLSDLANVLGLMLHARVVRNGRVLTLYSQAR